MFQPAPARTSRAARTRVLSASSVRLLAILPRYRARASKSIIRWLSLSYDTLLVGPYRASFSTLTMPASRKWTSNSPGHLLDQSARFPCANTEGEGVSTYVGCDLRPRSPRLSLQAFSMATVEASGFAFTKRKFAGFHSPHWRWPPGSKHLSAVVKDWGNSDHGIFIVARVVGCTHLSA